MSTRDPVRVADYMSSPVETVPPETPLVEAAGRMRDANIRAVVVTDDPLSILTSTDVVAAVADGRAPSELSVTDVATEVTATVGPDQSLRAAASLMLRHDSSHLPVTDDGALVGMLSKTDVTQSRSS